MSTLPGLASKGEKPKSKFQSLDINRIYRVSRGESSEKQQQKNPAVYKHGMQILGKVPSARRPPANLPSLKSEHSGNDTTGPLVPPGGPGWGKQESTTSTTNLTSTLTTSSSTNANLNPASQVPPQLSAHQAAIALPVTTTIPPPNKQHGSLGVTPVTTDKSWSAIMAGNDLLHHPPPYQSAQFQQEFPSLSCGDGGPTRTGSDIHPTPGLSLRPQTEGSWIQGGSRPGVDAPPRPNSGPLGVPPQLPVQAGLAQQPLPPQFRGMMPPFMYKGNVAMNGPTGQTNVSPPVNGRNRVDNRSQPQRNHDLEEISHRPIIKEEELSRMDDIEKDLGWAYQNDIDYNQKLAFSDDEMLNEKSAKKEKAVAHKEAEKQEMHLAGDSFNRHWTSSRSSRGRSSDEDEIRTRRSQHSKELELAVQRAKQRKEEEERRFTEASKGAKQKLKELEEKINKRDRGEDDSNRTINPNAVPNKPITPASIPLPEFQKDKDGQKDKDRNKSHHDDDSSSNNFRQLTQIEGKSIMRKHGKGSDRDARDPRDQNCPNFSKQFQSNLPPRFKKQQHGGGSNVSQLQFTDAFDNRWLTNSQSTSKSSISSGGRKTRDSPDRDLDDDRRDFKRHSSDESYRNVPRGQMDSSKSDLRHLDDFKLESNLTNEEQNIKKDMDMILKNDDYHMDLRDRYREEKMYETYEKLHERYDRPQRPDSRDSRASRESRHSRDSFRDSEPRDYGSSWADSKYEVAYEEKRREYPREDRRVVPGPITKERIEADDLRNEKRNLTQLKKGQMPDKKISEFSDKLQGNSFEDKDKSLHDCNLDTTSWAEHISQTILEEPSHFNDNLNKMKIADMKLDKNDDKKMDKNDDLKDKDDRRNRNRSYPQNKNWNSEYHRSNWSKRVPNKNPRSASNRQPSNEFHRTDSEGSLDDHDLKTHSSQKSPRPARKYEKDDKNKYIKQEKEKKVETKSENKKENYVPRGEPTRHGRGGHFRTRGGLNKRIDGYGPPPSKSPFGHHDDKDKKEDKEFALTTEEKNKLNQQALAAGIIGSSRSMEKGDDKSKTEIDKIDLKKDEYGDHSDNSENKDKKFNKMPNTLRSSNSLPRRNQPSRVTSEKRNYGTNARSEGSVIRQNSSGALKDKSEDENSMRGKDESGEERGDLDGFQEVKSKKNGKERQKPIDEKPGAKTTIKTDKDVRNKKVSTSSLLTPQQIQNIPPLMATLVNPPPVLLQAKQNSYDRQRPNNKIPPRFAKLREVRQKIHLQQFGDVGNDGKMGQNVHAYNMKESTAPVVVTNAWDKPLGSQLRSMEGDATLGVTVDTPKSIDNPSQANQSISPNEKVVSKPSSIQEKAILDGTTPPVNTIIFENTNFKTAPGNRPGRNDKPRKPDEPLMDGSVMSGFGKPMNDLVAKVDKQPEMSLPLFKEDNGDIKLDFLDSEISHLTEDKSSQNLCLSRPMHKLIDSNNAVNTDDALNFKIQSVKKVWETATENCMTQEETGGFSLVADPSAYDPGVFPKPSETPDEVYDGCSPSGNQALTNNTTNVCKVKPTQQISGPGQMLGSAGHQPHAGMVGAGLMGNPLSPPPPMQQMLGLGQPPQQYATNQHIGYQTGLGSSTQYNMPTIPSPPTVLNYNTQQLQAQTAGLYGHFQIDQGVLSGQGRSQYSQYPNHYGLGQTGSSAYSAQSVYLPPAQPHPPPTAQAPDMYSMNSFRLSSGPFAQNQQLSNPTTVLISSTSNSLMSASVKPSTQQISAIGSKAGGVGQAYQQQSQQGQQMYMAFDPTIQANYIQGANVMQRPTGPVQNNVVPTIQPSSSYYSGSTGGQTGYFQQPGSSTIQPTQLQQHQAGYGLQGNVFGTHNQSHNNGGLQSFSSQFLNPGTPLQLVSALSQQYRSGLPQAHYLKNSALNTDHTGRTHQLKSPSSQEGSSVFTSGPQIPSPKSRQNKQPPPQPSPTTQHKYNLYQSLGNQSGGNVQRYPTPIQRPVNYQQNVGSVPNIPASSQKHRPNPNNKMPTRQYYPNQGPNLSSQNDMSDDNKLNDNASVMSSSTNASSLTSKMVANSTSPIAQPDLAKDSKDESSALKD